MKSGIRTGILINLKLHVQVPLFKAYKRPHFKQTLMSVVQLTQLESKHFEQVLLIIEYPRFVLQDKLHWPLTIAYPV